MTVTATTITNIDPTTGSPPAASTPRLRLEPTGSSRTLLDGGWWPRSADPAAELPGLIMAIDKVRGPVTRLILSIDSWNPRPRRLTVAGRMVRLAYFTSQPTALLIASGDAGRVDLLVVPPDTAPPAAEAAMALAATASNRVHAQHLLATVAATPPTPARSGGSERCSI